jgi:tight adherence protein B
MVIVIAILILVMITTLIYVAMQFSLTIRERYQASFEKAATANLADMFMFVDAQQLFLINMLILILAPLLILVITSSWFLTIGGGIVILMAPQVIYKTLRKRRFKQFEKQLPDALVMLSGSMRAGASFRIALESVIDAQYPPLNQEFELFLRELRMGMDIDEALVNMTKRLPIPDFILVVSAIRIAREVGGNLGEILDTLADTVRRKQAMEGKIEGLTAQGKMQGIVMSCLPILLLGVLFVLEPEGMAPLISTPIGYATLTVIISMISIGYFFISRITNIDV